VLALTASLVVAAAACTSDFDELFSKDGGTSGSSGKPDASSATDAGGKADSSVTPAAPEACPAGKDCVVTCDGPKPCDYSCTQGFTCTVQCSTAVECTCTGAGCKVLCDVQVAMCGTTTACNRKCP
jgi:hypothetical protein